MSLSICLDFRKEKKRSFFRVGYIDFPFDWDFLEKKKLKMMRRQQQQQRHQHQDQQSRIFYELSSLVLSLLRSPPSPLPYDESSPVVNSSARRSNPSPSSSAALAQITPAGFASLMLGISVALMLCGSVTFFIGFMLMPWVLGLVMVFYVAGIVSTISVLGKTIFCYALAPPSSPRKEIPGEISLPLLYSVFGFVLLGFCSFDHNYDLDFNVFRLCNWIVFDCCLILLLSFAIGFFVLWIQSSFV